MIFTEDFKFCTMMRLLSAATRCKHFKAGRKPGNDDPGQGRPEPTVVVHRVEYQIFENSWIK